MNDLTVQLKLTVTYTREESDKPIDPGECHSLLEELARLAANRGLLSGDAPDLVVESWDYDVKTLPEGAGT